MATSWTGSKHESRAEGPRTVQGSRAHRSGSKHESTAHGSPFGLGVGRLGPVQVVADGHGLGLAVPGRPWSAHGRARSMRARPAAHRLTGSPAGPDQGFELAAREPGRVGGLRCRRARVQGRPDPGGQTVIDRGREGLDELSYLGHGREPVQRGRRVRREPTRIPHHSAGFGRLAVFIFGRSLRL